MPLDWTVTRLFWIYIFQIFCILPSNSVIDIYYFTPILKVMSNLSLSFRAHIVLSASLSTTQTLHPAGRLTWSLPLTTRAFTPTPPSPELPQLGSHRPAQGLQGKHKLLCLHLALGDTPAPIISFHLSRLRASIVSATLLALRPALWQPLHCYLTFVLVTFQVEWFFLFLKQAYHWHCRAYDHD